MTPVRALIGLTLAACQPAPLRFDGSSTVFPLAEAVVEQLSRENPRAPIVVTESGSAAGIARLCRGEIDVAMSSRAMDDRERAQCLAHGVDPQAIAVAKDAIAVAVHPSNAFATSLSLYELKRIWQPEAERRITRWRMVRSAFPDTRLQLYGGGAFSGTFDVFSAVIVGRARASRADFISSEDDAVLVHGVANDPGALGFFSFAWYRRSGAALRLVPIDFGDGPVLPTAESIGDGRYGALARTLVLYVDGRRRGALAPVLDRFVARAPPLLERLGLLAVAP
jgi:phosphate transport system substrate-binding protein